MPSRCATLLECQKLLGAECFVVDLRGGFNQFLKMGAGEEVSKVHEFAVIFVFHIDNAPSVLASADLPAIHDDRLLRSNDGEWDDVQEGC